MGGSQGGEEWGTKEGKPGCITPIVGPSNAACMLMEPLLQNPHTGYNLGVRDDPLAHVHTAPLYSRAPPAWAVSAPLLTVEAEQRPLC